MTGAGVVGAGIGVGLLLDASRLNDDANKNPDQRERVRQYDRADTRHLAGALTSIGGAGLLVAGVIKLAVTPPHQSRAVSWHIVPTINSVQLFG